MTPHDDLEDVAISALQARLTSGQLGARELARAYLERIAAIDHDGPTLRSVIELNPDALELADELDRERAAGTVRGPLHGIPILLKDNIDTADRMHTTAGSLALLGSHPAADATVARRLRAAGALILGKTNLSEWANFRSTRSVSGWSGRGRQTRNPFVLDRSPGGSSSGSGVAVSANLAAAALGTETSGSIVSPSSNNGIVGIKPTVGLTSRAGVVPISHSQDSVGVHARTVADGALLLTAIAGGHDPRDPATPIEQRAHDYTRGLDAGALRGARIGVARQHHTGYSEHTDRVFEDALRVLSECGAELIDQVEIPGERQLREPLDGADDVNAEGIVLQYEFKADLNSYLASRPAGAVHTLADVIRFNEEHAAEEMPYFRQERLEAAEARGALSDDLYLRAVAAIREFTGGFARLFEEQRFATLVAPTNSPPCAIDLFDGDRHLGGSSFAAAVAGWPLVTVPAGFAAGLLPLGLTFMGPAWSEVTLIRLAYAFERAHPVRRVPSYVPSTLHLP